MLAPATKREIVWNHTHRSHQATLTQVTNLIDSAEARKVPDTQLYMVRARTMTELSELLTWLRVTSPGRDPIAAAAAAESVHKD